MALSICSSLWEQIAWRVLCSVKTPSKNYIWEFWKIVQNSMDWEEMSCKCKAVMRGLLKAWWQQSWIPVIYTRFLLTPFSLHLFIILPWFTSSKETWHRLLYTRRLNASWDGLFPSFRATRRLELLMIWYLLTFHCKSLLLAQWGCSVVNSDQHRPIYLLASPALWS